MFPKRIPLIIYSKMSLKSSSSIFLSMPHIEQIPLPKFPLFLLQDSWKLSFKTLQTSLPPFGLNTFSPINRILPIYSRGRAGASLIFKHFVRQCLYLLISLPKEDILLAAETSSHSVFLFESPQSYGKSNQAIWTHATGTDCLRLEFQGFKTRLWCQLVPWQEEKQMKPQRHASFNLISILATQPWYENKT